MIDYTLVFVTFFAVIDPIGTVPVFIAVTRGYSASVKRKIAIKATLVSLGVLVFFVVAGGAILNAMHIPLSAFQISGGIVLFLFALSMIFGESKPDEEVRIAEKSHETAVFPLAIPSIAGPGAMLTAVLLTDNSQFGILEKAQITGLMTVVLLITLVLMLASNFIDKYIGSSGASIISRVMGLILASVATHNILKGLSTYFDYSP